MGEISFIGLCSSKRLSDLKSRFLFFCFGFLYGCLSTPRWILIMHIATPVKCSHCIWVSLVLLFLLSLHRFNILFLLSLLLSPPPLSALPLPHSSLPYHPTLQSPGKSSHAIFPLPFPKSIIHLEFPYPVIKSRCHYYKPLQTI